MRSTLICPNHLNVGQVCRLGLSVTVGAEKVSAYLVERGRSSPPVVVAHRDAAPPDLLDRVSDEVIGTTADPTSGSSFLPHLHDRRRIHRSPGDHRQVRRRLTERVPRPVAPSPLPPTPRSCGSGRPRRAGDRAAAG
ncbi:hypothetical protein GCM10009660_07410 [Catellatospora bangladeshensis]